MSHSFLASTSTQELFEAAFRHHQAGQLREAELLYHQVLAKDPRRADALHLLGVIGQQVGRSDVAFELFGKAIEIDGTAAVYHSDLGNALKGLGRLNDAIAAYNTAIRIQPDYAVAHYNLGVVLYELGRLDDAVAAYTTTIRITPDLAEAHSNLGNVLRDLGRLDDAVAAYNAAICIKPDYAEAHSNLGNALKDRGRVDDAVAAYNAAICIKPDYAVAHYNLGIVLYEIGRLDDAIAAYNSAIRIKPDYAEAHFNLGNALKDRGRLDDAVAAYHSTIRIKPELAEAHSNLGNALRDLGCLEDAIAAYNSAIRIKPDYAEAHSNLGNALRDRGRLDDAVAAYNAAIRIKPDLAEAHSNLGNTLKDLGRIDDAIAAYNTAIHIKPDLAEAHSNLGIALRDLGHPSRATASFKRAQICSPLTIQYIYSDELLLPIIPSSNEDIVNWRCRYRSGIEKLAGRATRLESISTTNTFSFYLAYHGIDNRELMEALCKLFRAQAGALTYTAPLMAARNPPAERRRIRVGFLSEYLVSHTIGKLYEGFFRQFDRSLFELVLIHAPKAKQDAFSAHLDVLADRTVTLHGSLAEQQQAVVNERLDVLFYPDIGMSPETYFLAFSRLALVQATSWGHPNTTGLDTIDYFISSIAIEPPGASSHYSEQLICLPHIPSLYQPMTTSTSMLSRADFGLPETGTLYGCLQSLFKLHPDFDKILADIAVGDPKGHIVLLSGTYEAWNELLRQRWRHRYPLLIDRIIFIPRQSQKRFIGLMTLLDVLLDPIHFGSGLTFYEAMISGTPVVTWPGDFMRGRIAAGAYRQMGIANAPVAERLEDYASVALALGREPERRRALRQTTFENADKLFATTTAVRELESFFIAAVAAAERGERLPSAWQPSSNAGLSLVSAGRTT